MDNIKIFVSWINSLEVEQEIALKTWLKLKAFSNQGERPCLGKAEAIGGVQGNIRSAGHDDGDDDDGDGGDSDHDDHDDGDDGDYEDEKIYVG